MEAASNWLLGGAIGSGKSAVRKLLEGAGLTTIDADSIGHEVLEPNGPSFDGVAKRWPAVVVNGVIDRGALGDLVFSDPALLVELESLTHPHIFGRIETRMEGIESPVILEIPLIDKAPVGRWRRLTVDATDDIRMERLVNRGMSRATARARMRSQPPREQWLAVADIVIPNMDGLQTLATAVDRVIPMIRPER